MKKLLSLALVVASFLGMNAGEVTLDFSAQGYANAVDVTSLSVDGVTANLGSNGKNGPKYYTTGTAVRVYAGGTVQLVSESSITKAVFTFSNPDTSKGQIFNFGHHQNATDAETVTVTAGTYTETDTEGVWTGSAKDFTITIPNTGGKNGHSRIVKIVVTIDGDVTPTLAAPKFSLASGTFYSAQTVEITATEGATIYYTTDGTDPTTASSVYSAPLTISETTTVKAIATKDGLTSSVSSATYTITSVTTVDNIAAYVALGNGAYAAIANPVTVFYVNGNNVWVKDETGIMCIYGKVASNMNYKNGDVIPGGFGGYLKEYNGGPEMTYNGSQDLFGFTAATAGEAVVPEEVLSTAVTADIWGHYVTIKSATVSDVSSKNFNINDAAGTVAGYNSYGLTIPTDGVAYDITGIVATHDGNVQLLATEFYKEIDIDQLPKVDNIAGLLATAQGTNVKFSNPVTAVYHSGKQLYIKDDSGFMLVYGSLDNTYNNGDQLTGIAGNWTLFSGMTEMIPIASTFGEATPGTAVEPETLAIEEISQDYIHNYLKIENVKVAKTDDDRNFTITDETGEMVMRLNFGTVTIGDDFDFDATYNVTGFLAFYSKENTQDGTLQLYPCLVEKVGGALVGDVNQDGSVNAADVTALYNYILNGDSTFLSTSDVNNDNAINAGDVTAVYNIILGL